MNPPGTISWNFLRMKLSPPKSLWWIPILVATGNIFKNRFVHRRCSSGSCEKCLVQSSSYGLQF